MQAVWSKSGVRGKPSSWGKAALRVAPDCCSAVRWKYTATGNGSKNRGTIKPTNVIITNNGLRVLDTTEGSQVDQRVRHHLHSIVPLLDALNSEQRPLELVFPRKRPLDPHA